MLLAADFVFISLTLLYGLGVVTDQRFLITHDLSYGEIFQYLKEFFIVSLFLVLAWRKKLLVYFAWALLFIYLLFDDVMSVHEDWGLLLVGYFDLKPLYNLRAQDFGELIVSMISGSLLLTFLAITYFVSPSKDKKNSQMICLLIAMLVFFGIFIDMVHSALSLRGLGLIEDGGEMMVMSIILSYIYKLEQASI